MDEIWIWRRMEHPNLLPFIGGALIEPPYFAVSPYCAHGNVLQYISRHKDVDRLQLIIDITRGVDYLHSSHVVHGDLKARNVLINDQGTALVADFGLSRLHSLSSARSGVAGGPEGTMHWLAPELLKAEHVNPTVETDVWAFAMTLYELYTDGQIPFVDIADRPSLHRHLTAGHRPARLTNVALTGADLAWGLMQRCWLLSAKERPTFSWILTALTLLRPVFQTPDVEMLIQSPSQFRKMGWADSIFAQWPQGISALTNLLR
ncbi:kinase-like domain-containing protein [Mycena metata]|uniref:Kinase-like domain-containing protein n=1 Tax=Mycena metata TaxID=1033252 RepID=A0AAD7HJA4_9AGAR|nr:kinase-like domain-containing protein [Mycena metata]